MSGLAMMLLCTTGAGGCILAGGLIARVEHIRPGWLENELRHGVVAFGGGVLLSAVALVLVPEGTREITVPWLATVLFLAGGFVFFGVERYLGLHRRDSPQLMAMLLDYVPESLALGGMFALGASSAPVLALLIGLQNLPEGFNAYRELVAAPDARPRRIVGLMAALVCVGPLIGTIGWAWAADHPGVLSAVMLFASGGILYLIFQDVAPQSHLDRRWGPAVGAVLGFGAGLLGTMLVPGA